MSSPHVIGGEIADDGGGSRERNRWAEDSKVYIRKSFKGLKNVPQQPPKVLASEDSDSTPKQLLPRLDAVSNDSLSLNRAHVGPPSSNGIVTMVEDRIRINLSTSKHEKREMRRKLENELDVVRNLVKKLEGYATKDVVIETTVKRVHSEVASVPLHQLSISALESSQGVSDNVEKEKRTPKANKFYRNSEFVLGKEKFPKSKSNGKKHGGQEFGVGFSSRKYSNQVFKNCCNLLEKLMKHKHGWVFNTPVDAKGLGLHDYFTIIKRPMDLGTVKTRLNNNAYKSPREFVDDVRLTFSNAMTYNPKGQDVYVMAEQLSKLFEEKWVVLEAEVTGEESRAAVDSDTGIPTPTSRKAPPLPPSHPPSDMRRILDRAESMTNPVESRLKPVNVPSIRTPAPKKPKAKDPHKRDMTYEEKQKLSTSLQTLPSEKLDNIVQIIKKRNTSLSQHEDEIEVDIDSVDVETLWELDRFIANYKKSVSKNKKKAAELATEARAVTKNNGGENVLSTVVTKTSKETKKVDEKNVSSSSPSKGEKQGDKASRSSSSSSSVSGSGSSSGSDSESSPASGSDAGRSPRT